MKIIDFKTVSPFFEQERDGKKPFTIRLIDNKDSRFRALSQWEPGRKWLIRIYNPQTGESFIREIAGIDYVRYVDWADGGIGFEKLRVFINYRIILLGDTKKTE